MLASQCISRNLGLGGLHLLPRYFKVQTWYEVEVYILFLTNGDDCWYHHLSQVTGVYFSDQKLILTVSVKMKDDTFAPFNVNCQVSSLLKMSTLYQLYINLNRYIAPLSNRNCDNTEQNFLPKTTSFMF